MQMYICTYLHSYIRTQYAYTSSVYTYEDLGVCQTYIHTYIHTYIPTYIHTFIHSCIHTCMHAYIHTYVHTDTYKTSLSVGLPEGSITRDAGPKAKESKLSPPGISVQGLILSYFGCTGFPGIFIRLHQMQIGLNVFVAQTSGLRGAGLPGPALALT